MNNYSLFLKITLTAKKITDHFLSILSYIPGLLKHLVKFFVYDPVT
jgi:hypothetical protein